MVGPYELQMMRARSKLPMATWLLSMGEFWRVFSSVNLEVFDESQLVAGIA